MEMRARINTYYPSLTRSEQKVADYVLGSREDIMYQSVTELADLSKVGETTVMRFCRKIGFKGYQDFRLALAQDHSSRKQGAPGETEESTDFAEQVCDNMIRILQTSMSLLDRSQLDQVIDWLDQAGSIQFFGVGSSGITGLEAKNRLLRIGRRAEAVTDNHIQAMMAVTMKEGDVAVGISVSGSTLDTNDILLKAKQSGAKVVAITHYAKSPIASIADAVLLTAGKEAPLEGGSLGSKISQLLMIDLLCEGLAKRDPQHAKQMREVTARAVIDRIY